MKQSTSENGRDALLNPEGREHPNVPPAKTKALKNAPLGLSQHLNSDTTSKLGESGTASHTPRGKNSGKA